MARKKLTFDPNEDPQAGYDKWVQEYLRLMNAEPGAGPVENEAQLTARKNFNYFKAKMKKSEKPETEQGALETERTTGETYKAYQGPRKKKPWPGWGEVLKKL